MSKRCLSFLHTLCLLFTTIESAYEINIDEITRTDQVQLMNLISLLNDNEEFKTENLTSFIDILKKSRRRLNKLEKYITELEYTFFDTFSQENFQSLNTFISDESMIDVNQKIERYSNGLHSLKKSICSFFENITISNTASVKKIWKHPSSFLLGCPELTTQYIVRTLGTIIYPNDKKKQELLMEEFHEWHPAQGEQSIEIEIFDYTKLNPVDYWIKMSECGLWRELAEIALRIISFPPTEAACERVFSARRNIMTKNISKIHDSVVEARAHLKASLYQELEVNHK